MNRELNLLGMTIGGYEILEQVGKGGMGTVYRARRPDGSIYAVKILAPHLVDNDVQRRRFYQEAEIAMRFEHPNIVRAVEVGEDQGQHYFAMEFVDGESLGAMLKRMGRIPERDAIRIIVDVARGLHKAHKGGLIHRDVKPDNILVTRDGQVKLTDMGLVKQVDADLNLTRTGRGLGTPHFMAPEQFRNAKFADARADVYSLGATLYMMVTGELPFRGNTPLDAFIKKSKNEFVPPEELNPELSKRVAKAIRMTMSADPRKRPASARLFAELIAGKISPEEAVRDAESKVEIDPRQAAADALWYVIYEGPDGTTQKVKGTVSAIEQQLRKGRITPDARASVDKHGEFLPIGQIEAFQEMLARVAVDVATNGNLDLETPVTDDSPPPPPPRKPAPRTAVRNEPPQWLQWFMGWNMTREQQLAFAICGFVLAVLLLLMFAVVAWR